MTDGVAASGGASAAQARADHELKGSGYELLILLLSILSVVNTAIVLTGWEGPIQQVALLVDVLIGPAFAFDFLYRLRTSRSRSAYLVRRWGWADFLAIFPALGVFRLYRALRVIRLLRTYGWRNVRSDLDRDRAAATFCLTLFMVILVVELAGMAIYAVESRAAGGNIKSAADAIWWGFVTITTVGYGDRFPTTGLGRVIGTLLLFAGIALLSVLTGFIANLFLAPREPRRSADAPPGSLTADLGELRRLLDAHQAQAEEIRAKLDDVERHVRPAAPGGADA